MYTMHFQGHDAKQSQIVKKRHKNIECSFTHYFLDSYHVELSWISRHVPLQSLHQRAYMSHLSAHSFLIPTFLGFCTKLNILAISPLHNWSAGYCFNLLQKCVFFFLLHNIYVSSLQSLKLVTGQRNVSIWHKYRSYVSAPPMTHVF